MVRVLTCEECGEEMHPSQDSEPIPISEGVKFKFLHPRCATADQLKQALLCQAKNQDEFSTDLTNLANNPQSIERRIFKEKYGTYDELLEEGQSRTNFVIAAILEEIEIRSQNKT
ncbi:MAG: hypothetical protein QQN63_09160 [Nitrosopumilus sp.]